MQTTTSEEKSSQVVLTLYNRRKQVFIQSLQSILQKIAQDKIVKQMLQDRTSGQFITKRLEEIVAQVVYDDREIFIDTLIQKLNAYEKLYSKDHAEMIRHLGTKILTISDSQNSGEVHYVRQIQSLNEQVLALQSEIVTLRTQKADQEVSISDLARNMKSFKILDPDYDPNSPTFMHIFGHVDLTDLKVKLKLIHTDSTTSRQLVIVFINKMKKIITLMKNKSKQSARAYARRVADYEAQQHLDHLKAKDIQQHYEDDVIPQLLSHHKDSVAKHKRINQEKQKEIDQLKAAIADVKVDVKNLKLREKQLISESESKIKNIADRDAEIENLRSELQKSVLVIQAQKKQISEKDFQISQFQDNIKQFQEMQNQSSKDIQSLQKEYDKSASQVDRLEQENEKLKSSIQRTEKSLQDSNLELEEAKEINSELTKESNERSKQISELQRKLNKTESLYSSAQREVKDMQENYERISTENLERKRTIESLKQENDAHKQTISRYEQAQSDAKSLISKNTNLMSELEMEKEKHQNDVAEYKNQIKRYTNENAKIEKQIKDNNIIIAQQKEQIDQHNEENENLRESVRKMTKKSSQLENDLNKVVLELESAHAEIDDFRRYKEQQEQNISLSREEKNELKRKIRELTSEYKEKENELADKIADFESHNNHLQSENEAISEKASELENQIRSMKKEKQKVEEQISSQDRIISQLKQDNESLKEKNSRVTGKQKQKLNSLENLENENQKFQNIFDEIQSILPIQNITELPDAIRELAECSDFLKQIFSAIGVSKSSDALPIIKDLKENSKILQTIASTMNNKNINSLSKEIKKLKENHEKLLEEHKRIIDLLPDDGSNDISAIISEIVEKQRKFEEQIDSAAKFISLVLATITGSSQTPLNFPLKKNVSDQLLNIVNQIKTRANADRKQIDNILERAKSLGYEGDDCMKACEFIAKTLAEKERQKTFESVGKELDTVRNSSSQEKDTLNAQIAKLKKKTQALRATIAQLQSHATQREDEQGDTLQNYEKKIRELKEELETERRVREELGKIGDGFSADTKYLKSKLSAKELKFFTFIQKVMQQDRQTKELHMKMKQQRENLLGEQNKMTTTKT